VRVLGVDPGLTRCGIGVVDGGPGQAPRAVEVVVVRTPADAELAVRLLQIAERVEAMMDRHRPDTVAIERVFSQHNVRTVMGTAQASGVVALAGLREPRRLAGKKPRASRLVTYASYLGAMIETGQQLGMRPADFALESIFVGGEIVTAGLKARAEALFGPVQFDEGYGMTETWPVTGGCCEQGHLHFEASLGLVEVWNLDTNAPAGPGEVGALVVTPLPPYRETTLVLRYNTEDLVRVPRGPLTCTLRHLPAVSNLLGKRRLSVQHTQGWTYPRQVLEALEALAVVPLPARCGWWAVPGGVTVEVVVRDTGPAARRTIAAALEAQDVPLRELYLVDDPAQLHRPLPLRCDLQELSFRPAPAGISPFIQQASRQ
jgi:acyl-CoA synthetase (AMP-forming)/AMP-acid ligase II